ncbi:serine hydrolase domain-containing protein [Acinetobacter piscicola]|uniref:serine hydrolase domain-containing protein n=1 Tax=Acinetobacter piscicola TaxID=2006115 RepID=UPI00101F872C|nr:serine hydrolase domain-containing protein [Acinetobacter piscicola]RYL21611.1 class A beta-lactamase-related serine hydrolase [Acinetobacter piscicola]
MNAIKEIIFADKKNYQGDVDERFIDLAEQFSRLQDGRTQFGGAALVVYFQGQKVVDIFTGKKSETENWNNQTLSVCYSTGKGVLATLAHILVSEGFLDYDTPVAQYWSEFGQNGKQQITLRHILSHQSGLFDIRNLIEQAKEMADWQHMLKVMEQATPRFAVGEDIAYQALTFGWLVGGVLEKATGQPLRWLMQTYLVDPLALDGAYFGVPSGELARVARLIPQVKAHVAEQSSKPKHHKKKHKTSFSDKLIELSGQNPQDFLDAMVPKGMRDFSFFSDEGLQAIIPAANGVFTAESLAKIYAMLANQGVWHDQTLIKPEIFKELSTIQTIKRDRVMPIPMKWRLGYHRVITMGKRAKKGFGHMGYNGSGAWCDPQRGLSFAYTHNFQIASITGDYRLWGLTQEALRCADAELKGSKGWF